MKRTFRLVIFGIVAAAIIAGGLYCALILSPCYMARRFCPLGIWSGLPAPKSHEIGIRMDTAEVTIRLLKSKYAVDGVFRFFNSGQTTTEWVGYPITASTWKGHCCLRPQFRCFLSWVNGKSRQAYVEREILQDTRFLISSMFSPQAGVDYHGWMAQRVTFPARAKTSTRVYYESDYIRPFGGLLVDYMVGTGSSWQNEIGSAAITIDGSAIGGRDSFRCRTDGLRFSRRLVSQNAIRFEKKHFKPWPGTGFTIHIPAPSRRASDNTLDSASELALTR